jgi:hypothetical protein
MSDRSFDTSQHGWEHWLEKHDQVCVGTVAVAMLAAYCFALYCVAHNPAFL